MTATLRTLVVALTIALLGLQSPSQAADDDHASRYTPQLGATFSNPLNGHGRDVLDEIYQSIQHSPRGAQIRLVVWNYDDPAITNALIAAKKRGVTVQVVAAASVQTLQFFRLRNYLATNPNDRSFALRCHNACRSNRLVMHAKIFLFSHVGTERHISMFGSTNLTRTAGNRQWNDQTTTDDEGLYDFFVQTFKEYAADTPVATGHDTYEGGRYSVVLFPVPSHNPVLSALKKVKCHGAATPSGAATGTTKVRIAIAGWFDTFGIKIAQQVRRLWDGGCNLRIVTTLAGRKINAILRGRHGRGPVPIRQVTIDKDNDRIPERYLHMKSLAIDGNYDGDPVAHQLFTGSPNWSNAARSSDEVWVGIAHATGLVRAYSSFIDQMFFGPASHLRIQHLDRPTTMRTIEPPSEWEVF